MYGRSTKSQAFREHQTSQQAQKPKSRREITKYMDLGAGQQVGETRLPVRDKCLRSDPSYHLGAQG
jgi:hypothetical protein